MIQRISGGSTSWTYYDGNGAALTSKSTEEQRYQIRSSVLGGQVISQVWGNGKKYRSYVRGIGNQTAVQTAYATATATLNESVLFEYSDVLNMSYRTTDKNAAAVATGDGGEGSPIETDPLGGSVGTSTPYIEEPIIYEPDPGYPELQPFLSDGPQMPGQDFASLYAFFGSAVESLPGFGTNWGSFAQLEMMLYEERVWNSFMGIGFVTNEQLGLQPGIRITSATPIWGNRSLDDTVDDDEITIRTGNEITGWNVTWEQTDLVGDSDWWQHFEFLVPTRGRVEVFFASADDARKALEKLMASNGGKCGQMINKLLGEAEGGLELRSSDVLTVFDDVKAGLKLNTDDAAFNSAYRSFTRNNLPPGEAGGGGATIEVEEAGQTQRGVFMLVGVQPWRYLRNPRSSNIKVTSEDISGRRAAISMLMRRLVHELVHAAGKSRTVSHPEMDAAGKAADPSIAGSGGGSINNYLSEHCPGLSK